MCRLVRGQFLSLREQEFVVAALSYGAPWNRIVFRHMLPNVVGPIVVACTLGLAGAILTEASLSFPGAGRATAYTQLGVHPAYGHGTAYAGRHALALDTSRPGHRFDRALSELCR